MKQTAPISAETPTGARTAQPKPYRSDNPVSGFWLWNSIGDFTVTCHNCRTECKRKG